VGTSSNGTGAFGASINLSTNEFNEKAYAELNNSYGSFNTWKNTIKAGTGLINGHFTVDARVSKIASAGYIDRASSDLRSLALSAAYINKNSSLRFTIFTGKEKLIRHGMVCLIIYWQQTEPITRQVQKKQEHLTITKQTTISKTIISFL